MNSNAAISLQGAKERAAAIGRSGNFDQFVDLVRKEFPWRFDNPRVSAQRDCLRIVDHHREHLLPCIQRYMEPNIRRVLDLACGFGGSAIALALVYPEVQCYGTDIGATEVSLARERAKLYHVEDRCQFQHVSAGQPLPFFDGSFDLCQSSSVLEYVTDMEVRRFRIQEMARLVTTRGFLFFSAPNRLYPFEIHTRKVGWNYFPKWLRARIVNSSYWEVRRLARPATLNLHRNPMMQLFTPWSNLCVFRESGHNKS